MFVSSLSSCPEVREAAAIHQFAPLAAHHTTIFIVMTGRSNLCVTGKYLRLDPHTLYQSDVIIKWFAPLSQIPDILFHTRSRMCETIAIQEQASRNINSYHNLMPSCYPQRLVDDWMLSSSTSRRVCEYHGVASSSPTGTPALPTPVWVV